MISSCEQSSKPPSSKQERDNEANILDIFQKYNIPTESSIITIIPPTECINCLRQAYVVIDSIPNLYILHSNGFDCVKSKKSEIQKCIIYDQDFIESRKLRKLYPIIIEVKNSKVVNFQALL